MGLLGNIFKKKEEQKRKPVAKESPKGEVKVFAGAAEEIKSSKKAIEKVEPKKEERPVAVRVEKKDDPSVYKILSRPLITEKATDLIQLNKYCFVVPLSANKDEVIKKVINLYGVKPAKVNFIRQRGKYVRSGRQFGFTKDFKKAIVTLSPNDKIELYEGV